jgi:peptide/nickel transport system substrate-binding protein
MSRSAGSPARRLGLAAGVVGALAGLVVLVVATVSPAASVRGSVAPSALQRTAAHKCLVMTGSGDPAFVRNFNPYTATGLPSGQFIKGALYEGLIVTPAGGLKAVPWLARSWKWSNGNKTLTLNLAKNAKWSDGKALTSADVVYSLKGGTGAQSKTMDIIGYTRPDTNIASISAKGPYTVVVKLKTVDSQFVSSTLNLAFVVPQHVWSKVADPATFTNPHPVSSGPFNTIARFTTQDYVFGKNARYWQAGKPKIACLEYVQASSNDAALALIQSGQVDWTHNFVANVEKAYQAKDPKHYHSFYATTAYPQSLVFDDTQYPYSLVAFRKALSQAIDRQTISKLGEYGYAPATSALGIEFLFPQWVTDPSVKAQAKQLATFNPTAAKKTLTDAGFTYKGSQLLDPKGNQVNLDIHVISGWSDWVASDQIIARNLSAIGINSKEVLEPDWNSWYPNASSTKNPTLLWQVGGQGSPFGFFNANLSNNAFVASGNDATNTGNWEHFKSDQGTTLLQQWKQSLDPVKQHAAATALEKLWLQQLPIVPLFVGPRWSTYSTKFFHCFDSPKNHFGDPIFTTFPDNVLSFTQICPGAQAGQ